MNVGLERSGQGGGGKKVFIKINQVLRLLPAETKPPCLCCCFGSKNTGTVVQECLVVNNSGREGGRQDSLAASVLVFHL